MLYVTYHIYYCISMYHCECGRVFVCLQFLSELTKLFQSAETSGNVVVTMKTCKLFSTTANLSQ
mgnify:CR=1 FL=1